MGICTSKQLEKDVYRLTVQMIEAQELINIQAKLIRQSSVIQLSQQNNIDVLRQDTTHLTHTICHMIRGDLRVNCQCTTGHDSLPNNTIIPTALEVVSMT